MRRLITVLLLLAAAGAAAWLWARSQADPWTTDSGPALAEFQAGREAAMKFYFPEAIEHLERALELDSEFIAPKILLAQFTDNDERRKDLIRQLRDTDPARLSDRENFLLQQFLGRRDGQVDAADRALANYLERHPEDPFALSLAANLAWVEQEWDRANSLYRRLLEVDPNWVQAQNRLGYIAMARGRFAEAEELFATYAYIAPDQPNPHDSMAELLTLIGRYDEARKELERALAIRPNFCASYTHLMLVEFLEARPQAAANTVQRAGRHCDEKMHQVLECERRTWFAMMARAPGDVWSAIPQECRPGGEQKMHYGEVVLRASLAADVPEAFAAVLQQYERYQEEASESTMQKETVRGFLHHARGLGAAASGELKRARQQLEAADEAFVFWGNGIGVSKLANLADLARIEEHLGNEESAAEIRQRIREINPLFLDGDLNAPLLEEWP